MQLNMLERIVIAEFYFEIDHRHSYNRMWKAVRKYGNVAMILLIIALSNCRGEQCSPVYIKSLTKRENDVPLYKFCEALYSTYENIENK
jgi:hypothetical protein